MVNHIGKISMKSAFVVSLVLCIVLVVLGRPVCAADPIKIGVVACPVGPDGFCRPAHEGSHYRHF
jgi:hypothetical protein